MAREPARSLARARASTWLNQTVFASFDKMRSPRRREIDRRDIARGAPASFRDLILFASVKNGIDQLSLDRRMPTVTSKFLPEPHIKFHASRECALLFSHERVCTRVCD